MKKLLVLLVLFLPLACAVPVPPSGGPPDQKPPSLVVSVPENGTTQFSGTELTFEFDEAVDVRTFTSAFSIAPDILGVPEISGSGKKLKVLLPEQPRPETTYIITLESTLRDAHGVVLERPITIAFSTGSQIDSAEMSGSVVVQNTGLAASGIDVFAYAGSDSTSLSKAPLYRTQTGKDGVFNFRHVAKQEYFVVAVEDRNRNRLIEPTERVAIPPMERIAADTLFAQPLTPWVLALIDTTHPVLDRVRAVSGRDLEIRFSESLWLDGNRVASFGLGDNHSLDVRRNGQSESLSIQLYFEDDFSRNVFVRLDSLLPGEYTLRGLLAVSDSSRNQAQALDASFSVPETLPVSKPPAFRGWIPDSAVVSTNIPRIIWPRELMGFRTTRPIDLENRALDAIIRDTSGVQINAVFEQLDPTLFVLRKEGAFRFDRPFFIDLNLKSVGGPDSVITAAFVYASEKQLGALSMSIDPNYPASVNPEDRYRVELFGARSRSRSFVTIESATPTLTIDKLPGGKRMFLRVSKGIGPFWNAGSLSPWSKPDPLAWITPTESVRARWEVVLPDSVSFKRIVKPRLSDKEKASDQSGTTLIN